MMYILHPVKMSISVETTQQDFM